MRLLKSLFPLLHTLSLLKTRPEAPEVRFSCVVAGALKVGDEAPEVTIYNLSLSLLSVWLSPLIVRCVMAGALKVGDEAPEVTIYDMEGLQIRLLSGETTTLKSSKQQKRKRDDEVDHAPGSVKSDTPLVVISGSYS